MSGGGESGVSVRRWWRRKVWEEAVIIVLVETWDSNTTQIQQLQGLSIQPEY